QRRQLVDERLAAARRHHDERVSTLQHRVDRLPLAVLKITMAKAVFEDALGFGFERRRHHVRSKQETDRTSAAEFPFSACEQGAVHREMTVGFVERQRHSLAGIALQLTVAPAE